MAEADCTDLVELFDWIEAGELVEAHNAWFERGIWRNICEPKLFWPRIASHQWRCSAAKAASHSLPRGLGDAALALNLDILKDEEGSAVMKKMAKPRKPLKSERDDWARQHAPCLACAGIGRMPSLKKDGSPSKKGVKCETCVGTGFRWGADVPDMPVLWHESRELLDRLFAYCRTDILAEEGISHALPDLNANETAVYLLDQDVNERGFQLDTAAIDTALDLIDDEFRDLNTELATLTGGVVQRATQRAKMMAWLADNGLELDDTQADTLDAVLEGDDQSHTLSTSVRRALEIMRALGRSSTSKFEAMRAWVCPDSRVHGGLLYHGASTGRWTGAGVQPHNFPKGELDGDKSEFGISQDDPEFVWSMLQTRDREAIATEFGSVMAALSSGLRGAIVAAPGQQLYVADFNAIETRVLFWVANEQAGLDIFRNGDDIYNDMASTIYGRLINRKKGDKEEGALGKVAILGLGYQMGASKFVETALDMGGVTIIEDTDCKHCGRLSKDRDHTSFDPVCQFEACNPDVMTAVKVVDAYRSKYWRVKQLWKDQQEAAISAVRRARADSYGRPVRVSAGKVTWFVDGAFLYCELPSGRQLAYPEPAVVMRDMPWGGEKPSLTYKGINQFNRRWERQHSYGGLLVENIVQAIARDLMAEAMLRCGNSGVYAPILSVHDEMLAEAAEGTGDVHEFEHLMATLPVWAPGLPVTAEGWTGRRYRK